jgi:hypothetical protein
MLFLFSLVWGLGAISANANSPVATEHSRLVQYVQQKYTGESPYPILIFDRDELDWRFAKAQAFGEDDTIRNQIIQKYIAEKTGFQATALEASVLEPYLTLLRSGANALPLLENGGYGKVKFCAVFPADPNSNRRLGNERILQLHLPQIYGSLDFSQIRSPLRQDQLEKISLFHELSHCLDTRFFAASYEHGAVDADDVHRGESFAETLALLLLAKEEITDIAPARSSYRSVYTRMAGEFMARNPDNGGGHPFYAFGGPIYYLSPSIEAAQTRIDGSLPFLRSASLETLKTMAEAITLERSFSYQLLNLIRMSFQDGRETTFENARRFELDFPSLFEKATEKLVTFYQNTDAVLESFFTDPRLLPSGKLEPIDVSSLCADLGLSDPSSFFGKLQSYRDDLKGEQGSPEAQRLRAAELASLFAQASGHCGLGGLFPPSPILNQLTSQRLRNRRPQSAFCMDSHY